MAWTYEQLFNGLSSAALNGQDSWSGSTSFVVQGSTVYEGAKAVVANPAGSTQTINRTFSGITDGSVYFALHIPTTGETDFYFILEDAGSNKMYVRWNPGANSIQIYDNGAGDYQNVATSLSTDTWYVVNIEFDNSGQPNKYRARVNTAGAWGAFTSWYTVNGGSYTSISGIEIQNGATVGDGTTYFDTITPTDPAIAIATPRLRTLMGVGQ